MSLNQQFNFHSKFNLLFFIYFSFRLGKSLPVIKALSPRDLLINEDKAKKALKIDESQPDTIIQIKLMDDRNILVRANEKHKISDLRTYIITYV